MMGLFAQKIQYKNVSIILVSVLRSIIFCAKDIFRKAIRLEKSIIHNKVV